MRRALPPTLAIIAAAVTALPGCGTSAADEQADLVVYSGRIPGLIGPVIDSYEKATGLDVETRFGDTASLAATLLEEGENSPADVFISQDAGALGALQDAGRLAPIETATLEKVPPQFRSSEDDWVGVSARARIVAYAPERVDEADVPASILEFAQPEWRGRVGWAPTNASLQAQITAMRTRIGDEAVGEWLAEMVANDVQVYPDNAAVRDAIANGEIDVGLINHYYVAQAIAAEGSDYPVAIHYLQASDPGSLVNVAGVAPIAGNNRPERTAEFIDFLLAERSQRYFAEGSKEYPLVRGVPADPSLRPLARIEQPDIDLSQIADLEGTLELMRERGAL
ncbi:MAG: iron ABC transporter substrate-binding protein [Thermoleophilaceae bacterium]|nr:iron ABC transporter substrate-binding protein [Thermoleophilaceae bacterium]